MLTRLRGAARRGESGQTLIMVAVMLPVLVGFVGLAIDVGYAFDYRKQMQTAADSAALAGAFAVKANSSISSTALVNVVQFDAGQNGFVHGGSITVSACRPGVDAGCTTTYAYAAGDDAVKVTISQPKPTFFMRVLSLTSMTIGASAVAALGSDSSSGMVILCPANCNNAFVASGNSNVQIAGDLLINSTSTSGLVLSGGNPAVAADYIAVSGSAYSGTGATPTPVYNSAPVPDPFGGKTPPSNSTVAPPPSGGTYYPGSYSSTLALSGTVTLTAGVYDLANGMKIDTDANVSGTGVTFRVRGGTITVSGTNTRINVVAPTSGANEGIVYWQDAADTDSPTFGSSLYVNFTGVFYAPGAQVKFQGTAAGGGLAAYTIWVVYRIVFSGGSFYVSNDFSSLSHGSPFQKISLAE